MRINNRIVLFFVLPTLAPLILPPAILIEGLLTVVFVAVVFLATGYFLKKGNSLALTLLIFMLGINFITRLMMFFSRSVSQQGVVDWPFAITSLLSLALSMYLVFRLDQIDIRAQLRS
jgi:hypothetical protein